MRKIRSQQIAIADKMTNCQTDNMTKGQDGKMTILQNLMNQFEHMTLSPSRSMEHIYENVQWTFVTIFKNIFFNFFTIFYQFCQFLTFFYHLFKLITIFLAFFVIFFTSLAFKKLRTSNQDNHSDITIKSETEQHLYFLRCLVGASLYKERLPKKKVTN